MAASNVLIRTCRQDDLPAVIAITGEVFKPFAVEGHIQDLLGPPEGKAWLKIKSQDLKSEVSENPDGCFVAELDGKVVGYLTTTIHPVASRGRIANLAVSAAAQGHGAGRKLLLRALEHFRSLGLSQAKIETLECNQAGQHLYPSVGFREAARVIHYAMPL